ncbi:hypothetical protein [Paraburkholderia youngii]|nr:hypothetical protein [Paraburkholderia youngii]
MKEDRPHIRWSKYWNAWECKLGLLSRIGETPLLAFNAWQRAALAGNRR